MKKKINLLIKILKNIKFSHPLYESLSDKAWSDTIGSYNDAIEDLAVMFLFKKDLDELNDIFTTPGCQSKEPHKIVLWDNGCPIEQLLNLIKSDLDNPDIKKSILRKVKLIKSKLKN